MGTEFYAVNDLTKHAYELGKGTWWQIADKDNRIKPRGPEDLLQKVYEQVYSYAGKHYAVKIASALWDLGPGLRVVSDDSWEDLSQFRLFGTRYLDKPKAR